MIFVHFGGHVAYRDRQDGSATSVLCISAGRFASGEVIAPANRDRFSRLSFPRRRLPKARVSRHIGEDGCHSGTCYRQKCHVGQMLAKKVKQG